MDPENDLVSEQFACPNCHERSIDALVCHDEEVIECLTCGTSYSCHEE